MKPENPITVDAFTHEARAHHVELHHLLADARQQFAACAVTNAAQGRAACVAGAMKQLRDYVRAHFCREEEGALLEEAVVRAPHLAHQVTMLEKQHPPLREELDQLVIEAENADDTPAAQHAVAAHFEAFAERLLAHETLEEQVLQAGLNTELDID